MCGFRGGDRGSGSLSLENHKTIGLILSNTGPDTLKNHKATKPTFNIWPLSARQRNIISVGPLSARQRNAIEMAVRPMLARCKWFLDLLSPHQLKKTLSELDPLLQNFLGQRMKQSCKIRHKKHITKQVQNTKNTE